MDSMKRFDQQLKKGVLEMILLKQISREPGYGYDLRVRIKENSCGRLTIEDGTLYPLLYRLEDEGCITAEWETTRKKENSPEESIQNYAKWIAAFTRRRKMLEKFFLMHK